MFKIISHILVLALFSAGSSPVLAQDLAKKKSTVPPPEQSSTVGVLGAHHDSAPQSRGSATPPPAVAAPEIPKVEAEPPAPLAAAPRDYVQTDQPSRVGAMIPIAPPPTGFLVDHPMVSGLVAGLIGSDLGSKFYGGTMVGDKTAAGFGYALRVALILLFALFLFRLIGNLAHRGGDLPRAPVKEKRREPSFEKSETPPDGRREPSFGPRSER